MHTRTFSGLAVAGMILWGFFSFAGCGSSTANPDASGGGGKSGGAAGEIPIIAAPSSDVPYQFGMNGYGVAGGAFLAKANMGSQTIALDGTKAGRVCVSGTVDAVPTPADGSHPPYSDYWGIELGFNLNQGTDSVKNPWPVPSGVTGFWFTVEGAAIPPLRFKTTPNGKDPAQEQDSCALVMPSSGAVTQVLFSELYVQCWDGPQGTGTTDTSPGLLDVGLQVAASTDTVFPVDFCLTHFGLVTN